MSVPINSPLWAISRRRLELVARLESHLSDPEHVWTVAEIAKVDAELERERSKQIHREL